MSLIPPLLEQDEVISDHNNKAEICNAYFATQCTPVDKGSPSFQYKTVHHLSALSINNELLT